MNNNEFNINQSEVLHTQMMLEQVIISLEQRLSESEN